MFGLPSPAVLDAGSIAHDMAITGNSPAVYRGKDLIALGLARNISPNPSVAASSSPLQVTELSRQVDTVSSLSSPITNNNLTNRFLPVALMQTVLVLRSVNLPWQGVLREGGAGAFEATNNNPEAAIGTTPASRLNRTASSPLDFVNIQELLENRIIELLVAGLNPEPTLTITHVGDPAVYCPAVTQRMIEAIDPLYDSERIERRVALNSVTAGKNYPRENETRSKVSSYHSQAGLVEGEAEVKVLEAGDIFVVTGAAFGVCHYQTFRQIVFDMFQAKRRAVIIVPMEATNEFFTLREASRRAYVEELERYRNFNFEVYDLVNNEIINPLDSEVIPQTVVVFTKTSKEAIQLLNTVNQYDEIGNAITLLLFNAISSGYRISSSPISPDNIRTTAEAGDIFHFSEFIANKHVIYETKSGNKLLFALRTLDEDLMAYAQYMIDVFDVNTKMQVGYIDFNMLPVGRDDCCGNLNKAFLFRLGFSEGTLNLMDKMGIQFSKETDLRSEHSWAGFFVHEDYRNKGNKGIWNLDKLMMTLAIKISQEIHSAKNFHLLPIVSVEAYYRDNFGSEDTGFMGFQTIDLTKIRYNSHLRIIQEKGSTIFIVVENQSSAEADNRNKVSSPIEQNEPRLSPTVAGKDSAVKTNPGARKFYSTTPAAVCESLDRVVSSSPTTKKLAKSVDGVKNNASKLSMKEIVKICYDFTELKSSFFIITPIMVFASILGVISWKSLSLLVHIAIVLICIISIFFGLVTAILTIHFLSLLLYHTVYPVGFWKRRLVIGSGDQRKQSIDALVRIGFSKEDIAKFIMAKLKTRSSVISTLCETKDKEVVKILIEVFDNRKIWDQIDRFYLETIAETYIEVVGVPEATLKNIELLYNLLITKKYRKRVQDKLVQIGLRITPVLLDLSLGKNKLHDYVDVRIAALEAIGEVEDREALGLLREVLRKEQYIDIRIAIVKAIRKIGGDAAITFWMDELLKGLNSAVEKALKKISKGVMITTYTNEYGHSWTKGYEFMNAMKGYTDELGKIGDRRIIPALERLLSMISSEVMRKTGVVFVSKDRVDNPIYKEIENLIKTLESDQNSGSSPIIFNLKLTHRGSRTDAIFETAEVVSSSPITSRRQDTNSQESAVATPSANQESLPNNKASSITKAFIAKAFIVLPILVFTFGYGPFIALLSLGLKSQIIIALSLLLSGLISGIISRFAKSSKVVAVTYRTSIIAGMLASLMIIGPEGTLAKVSTLLVSVAVMNYLPKLIDMARGRNIKGFDVSRLKEEELREEAMRFIDIEQDERKKEEYLQQLNAIKDRKQLKKFVIKLHRANYDAFKKAGKTKQDIHEPDTQKLQETKKPWYMFIPVVGLLASVAKGVVSLKDTINKKLPKWLSYFLAVALILPYYVIEVTYTFFFSRTENKTRYAESINKGIIYIDSKIISKYIEAAFLAAGRKENIFIRISDKWFNFGLKHPYLAGEISFLGGRLLLVGVSYFMGELIALRLGLSLQPLIHSWGILAKIIPEQILQQLPMSASGLFKIFVIQYVLGSKILGQFKDFWVNLKQKDNFGLKTLDAKDLLYEFDNQETKEHIKQAYKSGLVGFRANRQLRYLYEKEFGKREKNYAHMRAWLVSFGLYNFNVITLILPILIPAVFGLNIFTVLLALVMSVLTTKTLALSFIYKKTGAENIRKYMALAALLDNHSQNFVSGYVALWTIGAEIQTVVWSGHLVGGPLGVLADVFEGPNGVISWGNQIVSGVDYFIGESFGLTSVESNGIVLQGVHKLTFGKGDIRDVQLSRHQNITEDEASLKRRIEKLNEETTGLQEKLDSLQNNETTNGGFFNKVGNFFSGVGNFVGYVFGIGGQPAEGAQLPENAMAFMPEVVITADSLDIVKQDSIKFVDAAQDTLSVEIDSVKIEKSQDTLEKQKVIKKQMDDRKLEIIKLQAMSALASAERTDNKLKEEKIELEKLHNQENPQLNAEEILAMLRKLGYATPQDKDIEKGLKAFRKKNNLTDTVAMPTQDEIKKLIEESLELINEKIAISDKTIEMNSFNMQYLSASDTSEMKELVELSMKREGDLTAQEKQRKQELEDKFIKILTDINTATADINSLQIKLQKIISDNSNNRQEPDVSETEQDKPAQDEKPLSERIQQPKVEREDLVQALQTIGVLKVSQELRQQLMMFSQNGIDLSGIDINKVFSDSEIEAALRILTRAFNIPESDNNGIEIGEQTKNKIVHILELESAIENTEAGEATKQKIKLAAVNYTIARVRTQDRNKELRNLTLAEIISRIKNDQGLPKDELLNNIEQARNLGDYLGYAIKVLEIVSDAKDYDYEADINALINTLETYSKEFAAVESDAIKTHLGYLKTKEADMKVVKDSLNKLLGYNKELLNDLDKELQGKDDLEKTEAEKEPERLSREQAAIREELNRIRNIIDGIRQGKYSEGEKEVKLAELMANYKTQETKERELAVSLARSTMYGLDTIDLGIGDVNAEVSRIYNLLITIGVAQPRENFGYSQLDDLFTGDMKDAVSELQKNLNIEVTGRWDEQTAKKVEEKLIEKGLAKHYRDLLKELNYNVESLEGYKEEKDNGLIAYLENTETLIKRFQEKRELPQTGKWEDISGQVYIDLQDKTVNKWNNQETEEFIGNGNYSQDWNNLNAIFPISGSEIEAEIISEYGFRQRPAGSKLANFHEGIDIRAEEGTDVYAVAEGTVSFVGELPGYGVTIKIKHTDNITTVYAHLTNAVEGMVEGKEVHKGDVIAKSGRTGNASTTEPHLHFEVKFGDRAVDPLTRGLYTNLVKENKALADQRRKQNEENEYKRLREQLTDRMSQRNENAQVVTLADALAILNNGEFEKTYRAQNPDVDKALKAFEDMLAKLDEKGWKALLKKLQANHFNVSAFLQRSDVKNRGFLGGLVASVATTPEDFVNIIGGIFTKDGKNSQETDKIISDYFKAWVELENAKLVEEQKIKEAYIDLLAATILVRLFEGGEIPQELKDLWQAPGLSYNPYEPRFANIPNELLSNWQEAQQALQAAIQKFQDVAGIKAVPVVLDDLVENNIEELREILGAAYYTSNVNAGALTDSETRLNNILQRNFVERIISGLGNAELRVSLLGQITEGSAPDLLRGSIGASVTVINTESKQNLEKQKLSVDEINALLQQLEDTATENRNKLNERLMDKLSFGKHIDILRSLKQPVVAIQETNTEARTVSQEPTAAKETTPASEKPESTTAEVSAETKDSEPQDAKMVEFQGKVSEWSKKIEQIKKDDDKTLEQRIQEISAIISGAEQYESEFNVEGKELLYNRFKAAIDRMRLIMQNEFSANMPKWLERIERIQRNNHSTAEEKSNEIAAVIAEANSYEVFFKAKGNKALSDRFNTEIEVLTKYIALADRQREDWFKRYLAAILMGLDVNAPPTNSDEAAILPVSSQEADNFLRNFQGFTNPEDIINILQPILPKTSDEILNKVIAEAIRENISTFNIHNIVTDIARIDLELARKRGIKVDAGYFIGLVTLRIEIEALSRGEISGAEYKVLLEGLRTIIDAQIIAYYATAAYINYLAVLADYQAMGELGANITDSQRLRLADLEIELNASRRYLPKTMKDSQDLRNKEIGKVNYEKLENLLGKSESKIDLNALAEQLNIRILYQAVEVIRNNKTPWVLQGGSDWSAMALMGGLPLVNKFISLLIGPDKDAIKNALNDLVKELEAADKDFSNTQDIQRQYEDAVKSLEVLRKQLAEATEGSAERARLLMGLDKVSRDIAMLKLKAYYQGIELPEMSRITEQINATDMGELNINTRAAQGATVIDAVSFNYQNGARTEIVTFLTQEGRLIEVKTNYAANGTVALYITSQNLYRQSSRTEISGNPYAAFGQALKTIKAASQSNIPLNAIGDDEVKIDSQITLTKLADNKVAYSTNVGTVYRFTSEGGNRFELPLYMIIDTKGNRTYYIDLDYYSQEFSLNTGLRIIPVTQNNETKYEVTGLAGGNVIFHDKKDSYKGDLQFFYEDQSAGAYTKFMLGKTWRMNFAFDRNWEQGTDNAQAGAEYRVAKKYFIGFGADIEFRDEGFKPVDGEQGFGPDEYKLRPYVKFTLEENLGMPQVVVESLFSGSDDYELQAGLRKQIAKQWMLGLNGDVQVQDGRATDYSATAKLIKSPKKDNSNKDKGGLSYGVDTRIDNSGWQNTGVNVTQRKITENSDLSLRAGATRNDADNDSDVFNNPNATGVLNWLVKLGKDVVFDTRAYGQRGLVGVSAGFNFSGAAQTSSFGYGSSFYSGSVANTSLSAVNAGDYLVTDNTSMATSDIDIYGKRIAKENFAKVVEEENPLLVQEVNNLLSQAANTGLNLNNPSHREFFIALNNEETKNPGTIEFYSQIAAEYRTLKGRNLDLVSPSLNTEDWRALRALRQITEQPVNWQSEEYPNNPDGSIMRNLDGPFMRGRDGSFIRQSGTPFTKVISHTTTLTAQDLQLTLERLNSHLDTLNAREDFVRKLITDSREAMKILAVVAELSGVGSRNGRNSLDDIYDDIVDILEVTESFMTFYFVQGFPDNAQAWDFLYSKAWYIDTNYAGETAQEKVDAYMPVVQEVIDLADDLWDAYFAQGQPFLDATHALFMPNEIIYNPATEQMWTRESTYVRTLYEITGDPDWVELIEPRFIELIPWAYDLYNYITTITSQDPDYYWQVADAFHRIFGIWVINQPYADLRLRGWLFEVTGDNTLTLSDEESLLDIAAPGEGSIYEGYQDDAYKQLLIDNTIAADVLNTLVQDDMEAQQAITAIFGITNFDPSTDDNEDLTGSQNLYRTFLTNIVSMADEDGIPTWPQYQESFVPALKAVNWFIDNLTTEEKDLVKDIIEEGYTGWTYPEFSFGALRFPGFTVLLEDILFTKDTRVEPSTYWMYDETNHTFPEENLAKFQLSLKVALDLRNLLGANYNALLNDILEEAFVTPQVFDLMNLNKYTFESLLNNIVWSAYMENGEFRNWWMFGGTFEAPEYDTTGESVRKFELTIHVALDLRNLLGTNYNVLLNDILEETFTTPETFNLMDLTTQSFGRLADNTIWTANMKNGEFQNWWMFNGTFENPQYDNSGEKMRKLELTLRATQDLRTLLGVNYNALLNDILEESFATPQVFDLMDLTTQTFGKFADNVVWAAKMEDEQFVQWWMFDGTFDNPQYDASAEKFRRFELTLHTTVDLRNLLGSNYDVLLSDIFDTNINLMNLNPDTFGDLVNNIVWAANYDENNNFVEWWMFNGTFEAPEYDAAGEKVRKFELTLQVVDWMRNSISQYNDLFSDILDIPAFDLNNLNKDTFKSLVNNIVWTAGRDENNNQIWWMFEGTGTPEELPAPTYSQSKLDNFKLTLDAVIWLRNNVTEYDSLLGQILEISEFNILNLNADSFKALVNDIVWTANYDEDNNFIEWWMFEGTYDTPTYSEAKLAKFELTLQASEWLRNNVSEYNLLIADILDITGFDINNLNKNTFKLLVNNIVWTAKYDADNNFEEWWMFEGTFDQPIYSEAKLAKFELTLQASDWLRNNVAEYNSLIADVLDVTEFNISDLNKDTFKLLVNNIVWAAKYDEDNNFIEWWMFEGTFDAPTYSEAKLAKFELTLHAADWLINNVGEYNDLLKDILDIEIDLSDLHVDTFKVLVNNIVWAARYDSDNNFKEWWMFNGTFDQPTYSEAKLNNFRLTLKAVDWMRNNIYQYNDIISDILDIPEFDLRNLDINTFKALVDNIVWAMNIENGKYWMFDTDSNNNPTYSEVKLNNFRLTLKVIEWMRDTFTAQDNEFLKTIYGMKEFSLKDLNLNTFRFLVDNIVWVGDVDDKENVSEWWMFDMDAQGNPVYSQEKLNSYKRALPYVAYLINEINTRPELIHALNYFYKFGIGPGFNLNPDNQGKYDERLGKIGKFLFDIAIKTGKEFDKAYPDIETFIEIIIKAYQLKDSIIDRLRKLGRYDFSLDYESIGFGYLIQGGIVTLFFYNGVSLPNGLEQFNEAPITVTLVASNMTLADARFNWSEDSQLIKQADTIVKVSVREGGDLNGLYDRNETGRIVGYYTPEGRLLFTEMDYYSTKPEFAGRLERQIRGNIETIYEYNNGYYYGDSRQLALIPVPSAGRTVIAGTNIILSDFTNEYESGDNWVYKTVRYYDGNGNVARVENEKLDLISGAAWHRFDEDKDITLEYNSGVYEVLGMASDISVRDIENKLLQVLHFVDFSTNDAYQFGGAIYEGKNYVTGETYRKEATDFLGRTRIVWNGLRETGNTPASITIYDYDEQFENQFGAFGKATRARAYLTDSMGNSTGVEISESELITARGFNEFGGVDYLDTDKTTEIKKVSSYDSKGLLKESYEGELNRVYVKGQAIYAQIVNAYQYDNAVFSARNVSTKTQTYIWNGYAQAKSGEALQYSVPDIAPEDFTNGVLRIKTVNNNTGLTRFGEIVLDTGRWSYLEIPGYTYTEFKYATAQDMFAKLPSAADVKVFDPVTGNYSIDYRHTERTSVADGMQHLVSTVYYDGQTIKTEEEDRTLGIDYVVTQTTKAEGEEDIVINYEYYDDTQAKIDNLAWAAQTTIGGELFYEMNRVGGVNRENLTTTWQGKQYYYGEELRDVSRIQDYVTGATLTLDTKQNDLHIIVDFSFERDGKVQIIDMFVNLANTAATDFYNEDNVRVKLERATRREALEAKQDGSKLVVWDVNRFYSGYSQDKPLKTIIRKHQLFTGAYDSEEISMLGHKLNVTYKYDNKDTINKFINLASRTTVVFDEVKYEESERIGDIDVRNNSSHWSITRYHRQGITRYYPSVIRELTTGATMQETVRGSETFISGSKTTTTTTDYSYANLEDRLTSLPSYFKGSASYAEAKYSTEQSEGWRKEIDFANRATKWEVKYASGRSTQSVVYQDMLTGAWLVNLDKSVIGEIKDAVKRDGKVTQEDLNKVNERNNNARSKYEEYKKNRRQHSSLNVPVNNQVVDINMELLLRSLNDTDNTLPILNNIPMLLAFDHAKARPGYAEQDVINEANKLINSGEINNYKTITIDNPVVMALLAYYKVADKPDHEARLRQIVSAVHLKQGYLNTAYGANVSGYIIIADNDNPYLASALIHENNGGTESENVQAENEFSGLRGINLSYAPIGAGQKDIRLN
ncbi:MAG: peptidoglycan DD-metalloendopeptidase family protein, partial [Candidatus Omnitrophica bacterium]|nr:peptidoglycan DD-metalloendopeptidase family protein [Candidatus Omnitrophota bacterium]